jgi:amino acid transporter
LFYGVLVAAIALSGTYEWLTVFANLAALALYFLCAIAVLMLRKRNVRGSDQPFVIPGGPLVPVIACGSIAWLFFETARDGSQLYALLIALAIIFALYGLRALRRGRVS